MNKVKLTNDQAKAIEKSKGGKFYINACPVEYNIKHSFKGKLDKILLELTDYERERLTVKLAGGNE